MKKTNILIYLLCFSALAGCEMYGSKGNSDKSNINNYSTAYKAPLFEDSLRSQKINKALPELDSIFKKDAEDNDYPGFSYGVVVDDSLVLSGSTGTVNMESDIKITTQSLFRIASLTKSFTAMAILKMRDAGELSLTDPVSKYVSELENLEYLTSDAPAITIENLLTMTSGFPEDNPWADQQLEISTDAFSDLIQKGFSFSSTPNLNYEYSNLGYALLGRIISNISGISYQKYITEEILHPLEMYNTFWEYSDLSDDKLVIGYRWENEEWKEEQMLSDGAFGAIGGLITSIEDYSKYVAFHLAAWPPTNNSYQEPLSRSSVREMHLIHSPTNLYANAKDANGEACPAISGYGYGLGIYEDCNGVKRVNHSGGLPGYGTEYRFYPEYGVGVISFASLTYAPAGRINNQVFYKLKDLAELEPRQIQVSEILAKRKDQVFEMITGWDSDFTSTIVADNFFKDKPQNLREEDANSKLQEIGEINSITGITPQNQLRGKFIVHGSDADMEVTFSLSPEANPKVQRLNMRVID